MSALYPAAPCEVPALMRRAAYSNRKQCVECSRYMSADDAHRRCQKCRNGGKWPTGWTLEYQRAYRARVGR